MIERFAKPYALLKRGKGEFINGEYVQHPDVVDAIVRLDVQPVTNTTASILESLPEGRRTRETRLAFARLNSGINVLDVETGLPGDVLLVDGARWMFVGKAFFNSIPGRTRHEVFLIQREIETAPIREVSPV